MGTLLVGTDDTDASEAIADYLGRTTSPEDDLVVVNSLPGGDDTTADEIRTGEAAIDIVADRLRDRVASVETHQFVRGNDPVTDLRECAADVDADQFVVGVRRHTPAGKVIFGSTAQDLLLEAERPVLCVPLSGSVEVDDETPTIFRSH